MDERLVSAGRKGGIIKWSKIKKKNRSEIMRKVAQARWKIHKEKLSTLKDNSVGV